MGQSGWEIATILPFGRVVPIGLLDKLNSYGAVREVREVGGEVRVELRDGGVFGAYCQERPLRVELDGVSVKFEWEENLLRVSVGSACGVAIFSE
jgi:hypothetical protein